MTAAYSPYQKIKGLLECLFSLFVYEQTRSP